MLLIVFSFLGCEKDDICDKTTSTTPRIILEFYDNAQQTTLKNVSNLKVIGVGLSDSLKVFNAESKIQLPLKITNEDNEITSFRLILNSTIPASLNEDIITFNYTKNTIYVSRACGYKTTFNLLSDASGFIREDTTTPDGEWIKGFTIVTRQINNENETHIKIFF